MQLLKRILLALSLTLCVGMASAQTNEITLAWDAVDNADGYRIHFGTSTLTYTNQLTTALITETTIVVAAEGVEHFIALKAFNSAGDSVLFSREVNGFPAPEIVDVVATCVTTTGVTGVQCIATVNGFNFDPLIQADIPYTGVIVNGTTWLSSRVIEAAFDVESNTVNGLADLVVAQPWFVTPGTAPPGDDGVTGGNISAVAFEVVDVVSVILPDTPGRLRMKNK